MGFSIRKRTKGKSSWLNLSASKRKGVNASYSQKLGNLTLNFSKNGQRATYNFGNGIKWTSSSSSKKPLKQTRSTPPKQVLSPQRVVKKQPVDTKLSKREAWVLIFIMAIVILIIQLYMKGS